MSRVLIINGDDLGLTRAVSDGIFQAHTNGLLTSASLLVNQPATEFAVQQLARHPNLGVGIHLNLCQGRPVLGPQAVPSLVGSDGRFLAPKEMQARLMSWRVSRKQIEAEYRAQITLARAMGVDPTHADSHHHMHLFFAAVAPFRRALEAEGIQWIRACHIQQLPRTRRVGGPHSGSALRRLGVLAYMEFLSSGPFRSFRAPNYRIETPRAAAPSIVESMIKAWAAAFESLEENGIFELVCHPGCSDPESRLADRIHDKRVRELALLTAPGFTELPARHGLALSSYAGLASNQVRAFEAQGAA
jgi:predicted glycoside hydrolase/deacetylase ChbG (UPF0249 family)